MDTIAAPFVPCPFCTWAQNRVRQVFHEHGPLTDFELGYAYRLTHGDLDLSWSGLRTRRSELCTWAHLRRVGVKRNDSGRKVGIYALVSR